MRRLRETPQWEFGDGVQRRIAEWLKRQGGAYIVPSYDYSGENGDKPPRLEGVDGRFAIPDLDAAARGVRRWVEVKGKSQPTSSFVTRTVDHGIELRLLNGYREVEIITGTPVWLAIWEECSRQILLARNEAVLPLADAEPKRVRRMEGKPHLFIDRRMFSAHTLAGRVPAELFQPKVVVVRKQVRRPQAPGQGSFFGEPA